MATLYAWCAASLLNLISWSLTFSYDLSSALCARSSLFVTSLFAFCSALATSFETSSGDFDLLQPASTKEATMKIGIRYSRMQFPLVIGTRSARALGCRQASLGSLAARRQSTKFLTSNCSRLRGEGPELTEQSALFTMVMLDRV